MSIHHAYPTALSRGREGHSAGHQFHPVSTPAFQPSACATAQAFDHKTGVPAGKASRRQEDQRTTGRPADGEKASAPGAPGTRTPNLTAPTGPTPPVRQPYSRPPALQRKPLTTRLAFPQERQADGRKTSDPRRTGTPGVRQRHLPRDTHGRHSRPREGHSSFDYFIALSIN